MVSLLKKYCFQKKISSNQKPSVPDLHIRRAESCKIEYADQMPDWSCSYRQGNSGQLSEIAEAHSEDAFKGNTFADAINKLNPFEMNYYSASTRSRLARRQMSKELEEIKERHADVQTYPEQQGKSYLCYYYSI